MEPKPVVVVAELVADALGLLLAVRLANHQEQAREPGVTLHRVWDHMKAKSTTQLAAHTE